MTGPVARSLSWYRKHGYFAYSVSRWVAQARKTIDFAGWGDIIAYSPDLGIIEACQATTTGHQAERLGKILAMESAQGWVKAGGQIVVHGWKKGGKRGERKLWMLTVTPVGFDGDA
jgi:hypothetical protein